MSHADDQNVEESGLERFLRHLRSLRHDWSDDIPDEILHSDSVPGNPPKFKARKNWFNMVSGWIAVGLQRDYLEQQRFQEMYSEFHQYLHDTSFRFRHTTKGDIEKVNGMLDDIIGYVERK